ncbi:MAG: ERF family protein [Gammaproteobacteria bacterium]|nr:ERF family protein [Gammaproteobacteria bacterium]
MKKDANKEEIEASMVLQAQDEQSQELMPATAQSLSPIQMIQQLKESGLEVSDMKEMLALQKEYEAHEAKKLYNIALAAFKAEDILIQKDSTVAYGEGDKFTTYNHATLGNIVGIAVPFLSKHGFSHRWSMEQLEGGMIRVTFHLTHKGGHSEMTSLQSGADQSGGKNNIQAIASTVTYLERYTFLGGTGLATVDQDNDGADSAQVSPKITIDQSTVLEDLIAEVGADLPAFLAYCKIESISDLPAWMFDQAKKILEDKKS